MKTEYYIAKADQYGHTLHQLRKYIDGCEYYWLRSLNVWAKIGYTPKRSKSPITEEEAFRYILEN